MTVSGRFQWIYPMDSHAGHACTVWRLLLQMPPFSVDGHRMPEGSALGDRGPGAALGPRLPSVSRGVLSLTGLW